MATQAGALVVPDKIPGPWCSNQQLPPHHQLDERETFLMWLRGEFAAANAIIDGLCHHLRAVGDPGEYDGVIGCIQQRRCNWNPVLHMQQYFSVAEVLHALQQVEWSRQQRTKGNEGVVRMGGGGKEFRRGGKGQKGGVKVQGFVGEVNGKDSNHGHVKNNLNMNDTVDGHGEKEKLEEKSEVGEKKESKEKTEKDSSMKQQGSSHGAFAHITDKVEVTVEESCAADGSGLEPEDKRNLECTPKTFAANEFCDGKVVNVAEGMKLYEKIINGSEILQLTALVNDLRAAGKKGQLQGQTYVISKYPMKGHGREMIQLGIPCADPPPENGAAARISNYFEDLKTEPIPELLEDVIERLLKEQIAITRPDSCIIDIFNEGDYSQPHYWPQRFGRPVFLLFLTECEICFSKVMAFDRVGDYRGALRLSLSPGSMLVMQGRSTDFARHALPSVQKERILITFIKSHPAKINSSDVHYSPPTTMPPSHRVPPPIKSPNHNRPVPSKHLSPASAAGMLPTSTVCQQLTPPNGLLPVFVPAPVAPVIAFPAPVALAPAACAGWPATTPRHPPPPPPPHLPLPGTGVFLPSKKGSSDFFNQPASTLSTETITVCPSTPAEDCGLGKSKGFGSLPKIDSQSAQVESNGSTDGTNGTAVIKKEGLSEDLGSSSSDEAI